MVERGIIGVGGFILLLLIESVRPFRRPVEPRWRRYAINLFIAGSNALLLSVLLGGLIVAAYHSFALHRFGLLHRLGIDPWWNALITIVALDGVTYAWHRAYHGVPIMWRLHRVHHSDRDLDVTTSGRFHLTEMALSAAFRLVVIALLGAEVASVVLFEILFGLLNQVEHSNLRIPEPFETWLRAVFVTPDMHRLHHAQEPRHTNSNYSTIFSWWDRLFGTYQFGAEQRRLAIGLPEYQRAEDVTFSRVMAMPFGPPCQSRGGAMKRALASAVMGVAVALAIGGGGAWAAEPAVGQPAPDFTLTDTNGQPHSLAEGEGRYVVLEWSNHECPFVKKHYGSGNMQRLQNAYAGKGVTWWTIVSSAPGKQGHVNADQANAIRAQRGDRSFAMLLDPNGAVGRRYGAKTTPHLFIIDPEGVLIYAGAIDNQPSADPADLAGATNYVQLVLDEAMAGKPASVASTKSYGCSVKY